MVKMIFKKVKNSDIKSNKSVDSQKLKIKNWNMLS